MPFGQSSLSGSREDACWGTGKAGDVLLPMCPLGMQPICLEHPSRSPAICEWMGQKELINIAGLHWLFLLAAGSNIHAFVVCITAWTTGYIGEQSALSNINRRVTPFMPTSCAQDLPLSLQDSPGSLCRVGCMLLQGAPKVRRVWCERAVSGNLRLRTRREESPEKLPCYEAPRKGLRRRLLLYRLNGGGGKFPPLLYFELVYASEFFLVLK